MKERNEGPFYTSDDFDDDAPSKGPAHLKNKPETNRAAEAGFDAHDGNNYDKSDAWGNAKADQAADRSSENKAEYKAPYRSKVTTQTLDIEPPETKLPAQVENDSWTLEVEKAGVSLGSATLIFGVLSVLGFFTFDAYTTLVANVSEHPIGTGVLGALLAGFVSTFSYLSFREWRGYKQVNTAMNDAAAIRTLLQEKRDAAKQSDISINDVNRVLTAHGQRFTKGSYAAHCFARYKQTVQSDMTASELLGLYEDTVLTPVQAKAHKVLNKESVTAGSLAFISPNNLIQTFAVIWISFRTIRRMARVYGLRPSTAGNWKLLKVLAQNIAAQGIFDLATDEVANQIGGSLSAKFMENSAEAIAAGALNARLGRALIALLK